MGQQVGQQGRPDDHRAAHQRRGDFLTEILGWLDTWPGNSQLALKLSVDDVAEALRFAADYVAFPFAVKLHFNGADQVIEVIDTFRLNNDGKITEMRAFWGPENMRAA